MYALVTVLPLLAVLEAVAATTRARVAVAVYAVGLCSMFTASATYHRWVHTLRAREVWRRIDHAMIFAAIGGSITPICLLGVPSGLAVPLLSVMWAGCLVGIGMKLVSWRHQRIVGGVMYIAISCGAIIAIPALWHTGGAAAGVLMIVSGVFYLGGALGLNLRRPTLRPAVFGYHEVWHACTVIAAAAHLGAVWIIAA